MLKKYRYGILGILSVVANAVLVFGGILIIFYVNQLQKMMSNYSFSNGFSANGMKYALYLFMFGLAFVFVVAIYQFLYFFFTEKKRAVLFGGIACIVTFFVYLIAISSFLTSIVSLFSSFFGGSDGSISTLSLWMAFIISILALLFNGAIVLQMRKNLFIPFLANIVPTAPKVTVMNQPSTQGVNETVETSTTVVEEKTEVPVEEVITETIEVVEEKTNETSSDVVEEKVDENLDTTIKEEEDNEEKL